MRKKIERAETILEGEGLKQLEALLQSQPELLTDLLSKDPGRLLQSLEAATAGESGGNFLQKLKDDLQSLEVLQSTLIGLVTSVAELSPSSANAMNKISTTDPDALADTLARNPDLLSHILAANPSLLTSEHLTTLAVADHGSTSDLMTNALLENFQVIEEMLSAHPEILEKVFAGERGTEMFTQILSHNSDQLLPAMQQLQAMNSEMVAKLKSDMGLTGAEKQAEESRKAQQVADISHSKSKSSETQHTHMKLPHGVLAYNNRCTSAVWTSQLDLRIESGLLDAPKHLRWCDNRQ